MNPFWPQGQAIQVADQGGCPLLFRWEQRPHPVQAANAHWRVHTAWWTGVEVWRDYWEVSTDTGLWCVLYHDLVADTWRLERIFE